MGVRWRTPSPILGELSDGLLLVAVPFFCKEGVVPILVAKNGGFHLMVVW